MMSNNKVQPEYVTVSDATRRIELARGVTLPPRTISDLFYARTLRDDICPIVGGRRLIPVGYLSQIVTVLEQRGVIPQDDRQHQPYSNL